VPQPPVTEDPSVVGGHTAKARFNEQAAKIRGSAAWSDDHKATLIAALWQETLTELAQLREDFNSRQQARWDALQATIPTGPDIPTDTPPADRALMLQLFQGAVDKARGAAPDDLARMYSDARRFGDDLSARAAFLVAQAEGRANVVRQYKADHPEIGAALDEMDELRAPAGRGFITQALAVGVLGGFQAPAEVAAAARNEARADAPATTV
jgi:hypothetical protein